MKKPPKSDNTLTLWKTLLQNSMINGSHALTDTPPEKRKTNRLDSQGNISMNSRFLRHLVFATLIGFFLTGFDTPLMAETSQEVSREFAAPSRQYSTAPLWVWNDLLTETQIRETLGDLAAQHVRGVFVHPRPGLMTPYLSKDWFRLWRVALDEAKRLDMDVWIYDENSYPSGFAGGLVPEAMPESRGKGLHFRETDDPTSIDQAVSVVYRLESDGRYQLIAGATQNKSDAATLPAGHYLVGEFHDAPSRPWFGGKYYVDLLKPGVTEKFIEITMEAYRRELGDAFGDRVPGWFTDEPHLNPAGGLTWTDDLPDQFHRRWGYSLWEALPSLVRPVGNWRAARYHYYRLVLELYIERWSRPCHDYCEKYGLEFTGHYWEHEWPTVRRGPDNMAMYAWHQRPAVDLLLNRYQESVHAQFGNVRAVKELASVANQLGRKRTLAENYGAAGWDARLEDIKRLGDWSYALGVNTLNEHLSYITIRGARKRDHPLSFSYHQPWWEAYHGLADYFTRLSVALSAGKQINRILVLEPTTTAWLYQGDPKLEPLGNAFQSMLNQLEQRQVEYDLGSEDILGRHGSASDAQLRVGHAAYDLVVLPAEVENLGASTVRLLREYTESGGTILCCSPAPTLVDGTVSDEINRLTQAESWKEVSLDEAIEAMQKRTFDDGLAITTIETRPNQTGQLGQRIFHHRRRLDDGELLFLINSGDQTAEVRIRSDRKTARRWSPEDGTTGKPFAVSEDRTQQEKPFAVSDSWQCSLRPSESRLFFLSDEPVAEKALTKNPELVAHPVQPEGNVDVARLAPNVLTLDFVDVTVGDETRSKQYTYVANRWIWEKHGIPANPWDCAVQFRDELIKKTFPADSGFSATYRFTIREKLSGPLRLVVERPDLYEITCNGQKVHAEKGQWWLDKSFGVLDLTNTIQTGENRVTLTAAEMTIWHELEAAYLLGDFSLVGAESGFVVVPPVPLEVGLHEGEKHDQPDRPDAGWAEQGMPFYASGVAYSQSFKIEATSPKQKVKYTVSVPDWFGSVAKVLVNDQTVGYLHQSPGQLDVTEWLHPGRNRVTVVVVGTLKNTLGPHHTGRLRGIAGPGHFQVGPKQGPPPGKEYDVINYGLFRSATSPVWTLQRWTEK